MCKGVSFISVKLSHIYRPQVGGGGWKSSITYTYNFVSCSTCYRVGTSFQVGLKESH